MKRRQEQENKNNKPSGAVKPRRKDKDMTLTAIKELCKNKLFTHEMMLDEIKSRVANDKILTAIWETGMSVASNDEERKTVMFLILDCNQECKEIFATYLYYQMN